jgi:hypothetical protein
MPGGARSQLALLEQDYIVATHVSQVVGNRTTDDSTTDNNHSCAIWET